jgi:acyl-CoA synthetase (NDP forming)
MPEQAAEPAMRLPRGGLPIDALFAPRSIAVVGASERPSARSSALLRTLETLGYAGTILPVNPRYDTVGGRPCHPSIASLPAAPDAVALCIAHADTLLHVEQAAQAGARAVVVYESGFAERGAEGRALQQRVVELCREASIALCGPNCMGVLNPWHGSSLYKQAVRDASRLRGSVGLVSQSGSICIGMLSDVRRFGFSHVVSSGNEAVLATVDFLEALIDDEHTRVIGLFMESVQHPERFVAALDRAADAGKPVVVLKVGRHPATQRAIASHTGGLAGSSRVFSALLRAHHAIEVTDLDEFTEVLAACQARTWPAGDRIAVVTASGGQAELVLDVADAARCRLPPISPALRQHLEPVVGAVSGDGNPLDAWGSGDLQRTFPAAMGLLAGSGEFDAVVMCMDGADAQPMGSTERLEEFAQVLATAANGSALAHYALNLRPGVVSTAQVDRLASAGLALLGGTRQGLGALRRLARWSTRSARPALTPADMAPAVSALRAQLRGSTPRPTLNEHDAKRVLAAAGLPVARERLVHTEAEAVAAAADLHHPVVLKVVSDAIAHKTEHGLVALDLRDGDAVRTAWATLNERASAASLGDRITGWLVQDMVAGGIECLAGIERDPDFGLVLVFGLGGIAVEVVDDTVLRPLPLRRGDALEMIHGLRASALFGPLRGAPPADVTALVDCLERLAAFAIAAGDQLASIDLNPIKVMPEGRGCRIVDALLIPALAHPQHCGTR